MLLNFTHLQLSHLVSHDRNSKQLTDLFRQYQLEMDYCSMEYVIWSGQKDKKTPQTDHKERVVFMCLRNCLVT